MRRRADTGVWWASPQAAGVLALVPTVLAIFLIAHELTLHDVVGGVTLQQAGVNFASSLALSKGQLPYDNFVLTQPPGMSILLLPFAWVAHTDAGSAVTAARALTAFVAVIDVFLVAFSARLHGIASTFVAGVVFAMFPYAFSATASVMFEPYLLLFCLLAFHAAFTQGQLARGGRLVLAGALVGFAVAIKPWAILPAIVLVVCAAFYWREAILRVLGGLVLGIVVPCITFFLAAPHAFVRDVVNAELSTGSSQASSGLTTRIAEILGVGAPLGITHPDGLAVAIAVVLVVLILVAALWRASTSTMLDWALLATAAGLVVIAILPSQLSTSFTYFLAAFGAIVIGNSIGSLVSVVSSISVGTGDVTSSVAGALTALSVAAMIVVVAVGAPKETDFWRTYFLRHGSNPAAAIDAIVPRGSCVVSNSPGALVLANRFAELPPGCPFLVDPGAITKVAGSQSAASPQWEQLLSEAGYVVIAPGRPRLPDTPQLRRYITRNFQLVHNAAYLIYRNTNTAVSPQI